MLQPSFLVLTEAEVSLGALSNLLQCIHFFECAQLLVELLFNFDGGCLEVELVRFSYVRHTHIKIYLA